MSCIERKGGVKDIPFIAQYTTLFLEGFHDLLKSLPFIVIGWVYWIIKMVNYLSCIEGKGGLQDIPFIVQYTSLFLERFHDWLKSLPFIVIGWVHWILKRVNYLSCIEGKGGLQDIPFIAQYTTLFFFIYYKISF